MDRATLLRGLVTVIAVLIVGLAFVTSYVGGLHEPKFHRVPIAVLGPAALAAHLSHGVELSVDRVSSRARGSQADRRPRRLWSRFATSTGLGLGTRPRA